MLPTTIATRDPASGAELPVPAELLRGVKRANELLEEELGELTEKFSIASKWQFVPSPNGGCNVELDLTAGENQTVRVRGWTLSPDVFRDDDAIRRALRLPLTKLGHMLSALVKLRLERLQKQIQQDLVSLVGIAGE